MIQDEAKRTRTDLEWSPGSAQIPWADGCIRFGPVCVQPGAASAGKCSLSISANGVQRYRVHFELLDAYGISQAEKQALQALNDAKATAKQVRKDARLNHKQETLNQQHAALLSAKQTLQQCPGIDLSSADIQEALQHINVQLGNMPPRRSQRFQPMSALPWYDEVMSITGVLGYVRELICVWDEDDARLLSWKAKGKLRTLVVENLAVSEAVEQQVPGFTGMCLLLDSATKLPSLQQPHHGVCPPLHVCCVAEGLMRACCLHGLM